MKKILTLSLLLAVMFALAGCNSNSNNPNTTPGANTNQESTVKPNAVSIKNFAFNPSSLTVKKGTTVTWTNNDSAPHQIKSATFNSGLLSNGQTFSFTFNDAGTFDYSCAVHPFMQGKIIVE